MAPKTDRAAASQIIDALIDSGATLTMVYDGEEEVPTTTKDAALNAIFAVDMAHLHVTLPDGRKGWVWFVLGNGDPLDMIADHTINLSDAIDPVMEGWAA